MTFGAGSAQANAVDDLEALVAQAVSDVTPGYYRIVSGYTDFPANSANKALYGLDNRVRWTNLDNTDASQIWEVSEFEGQLYLRNVALDKCAYRDGDYFWLHADLHHQPLVFKPYGEGNAFFITDAEQTVGMHAQGHYNGWGGNGNVCTWEYQTATSATSWLFVPVTASDANTFELQALIGRANASVQEARDFYHPVCEIINPVVDTENKLVTSADNISSPCSDSAEGQHIEYLIDGITDQDGNFWHSDWHGTYDGTWCDGYHYVQFDLGAEYQKLALYYVNRIRPEGNNNTFEGWPEEFTVYYADAPDAEEWTRGVSFGEGDMVTNLHQGIENYLPFYVDAATRYIRIVCTKGYAWTNGHKFWMAAELNLCQFTGDVNYDAGIDLLAKADLQGSGVATALVNAIATAEGLANPTEADFEALQSAYEAFLAVYTSPATLQSLIVEAKNLLNSVEYGEEVGKKPVEAQTALSAAIAEAEGWLVTGMPTCTKAENTAKEDALRAAIAAWNAVAVNPDVPTAVKAAAATAKPAAMFDLAGRRTAKAAKGLYIMDGKKVVVK